MNYLSRDKFIDQIYTDIPSIVRSYSVRASHANNSFYSVRTLDVCSPRKSKVHMRSDPFLQELLSSFFLVMIVVTFIVQTRDFHGDFGTHADIL